jgi:hypothetical protein
VSPEEYDGALSFSAPFIGLALVIALFLAMAYAHKPPKPPEIARLCIAHKPFILDGIIYPAGDYYPCRWLKQLEQNV